MIFRNATPADLAAIIEMENSCFQPNEAASPASFSERLRVFPQHFWLLMLDGEMVGFINGMVSNNSTIIDEMFQNANLHDEAGKWQAVFGLAVSPAHRKRGYAGQLIKHLIYKAKEQGRLGITLTCKAYLVGYYQQFDFADLGISASVHGGEVWHDMALTFNTLAGKNPL